MNEDLKRKIEIVEQMHDAEITYVCADKDGEVYAFTEAPTLEIDERVWEARFHFWWIDYKAPEGHDWKEPIYVKVTPLQKKGSYEHALSQLVGLMAHKATLGFDRYLTQEEIEYCLNELIGGKR